MNLPDKSGPVRVGNLIHSILNEAQGSGGHRPEAVAVVAAWPGIVGGRLAGGTRAVSLDGGRLFVEVRSPVWKQEILLQKRQLIHLINSRMGQDLVADLVINVRDYLNVERS